MLGRSFNTAAAFAEDLAKKGILLQPSMSSVLSELVGLSTPIENDRPVPAPIDYDDNLNFYSDMLEFHSAGDFGVIWGASFDSSVEKLTGCIKAHISYIHNTVVPRTIEFAKDSQAFMEMLGGSNAASELEICRTSIPDIVQEAGFLSLLETFKYKKTVNPNTSTLNFDMGIPDDFLTVASTSNTALDNLVASWYVTNQFKYLDSVWYSFFASSNVNRNYKGSFVSQDDMNSPDMYVRLNVSLAYFLIANYYTNHLPDMITNESTASVKNRLFEHMFYAGTVLINTLGRISNNNKSDILVTYVDTFHKKITVSSEVYDRWLTAGGNADIIMGILVGSKRFYSVSEIDKNAIVLQDTWKKYVQVYLESLEYTKAASLRKFYYDLFCRYMTADYQEDLEQSFLLRNPSCHDNIKKEVEKYLHGLRKETLCDVQTMAKKLIAGYKYHFTYAEKFVNDMQEIGTLSENTSPEEAAFIATINYIVDYLQGQIQIVRI